MKIKVICKRCGKEFEQWPSRIKDGKGKYCSKECRKNRVTYSCKGCGRPIIVALSTYKSRSGKQYCSRKCYFEHTNTIITCRSCGKKFRVWKSRAWRQYCNNECAGKDIRKHKVIKYKGTKYYKTTYGYYASRPKGKHGIMLHRQIFEDTHKIKLEKHHIVHHLNGNRLNNEPSNLELWTISHPKGIRIKDQ